MSIDAILNKNDMKQGKENQRPKRHQQRKPYIMVNEARSGDLN